jgi:thioredoxin reductase
MARAAPWDVIIVGAGPAGLSAALILGRCRRRVLLSDSGTPRSWAAHRMRGFLSRDGIELDAFRTVCHEQLQAYASVTFHPFGVGRIQRRKDSTFRAQFSDGSVHACRKVLLASGVFDQLPPLPQVEQFFGVSVHPCPYCEGWEMKDLPIAIYGKGTRGFEMSRAMTCWSSDLLLCTDGPPSLSVQQQRQLRANGIAVNTEKITGLIGHDGKLEAIQFAGGVRRSRRALFFDTPCHPQSQLAESLGCRINTSGSIHCGSYSASSVPGVFAAGNILKDVQLSIVAAAEGARAAFGINRALTRERFARQAKQSAAGFPARM